MQNGTGITGTGWEKCKKKTKNKGQLLSTGFYVKQLQWALSHCPLHPQLPCCTAEVFEEWVDFNSMGAAITMGWLSVGPRWQLSCNTFAFVA